MNMKHALNIILRVAVIVACFGVITLLVYVLSWHEPVDIPEEAIDTILVPRCWSRY